MSKSNSPETDRFWKGFWPAMAVLALVLAFLFRSGFLPGMVHFSSDGPLGVMKSDALAVPGAFTGFWMDLHWVGMNGNAVPANLTYLIIWILGPVGFSKFYAPVTLLILGACAWTFFRTLRLSSGLCGVAAIAAALNMNYLSNACWGVGTRGLTLASAFLALAALNTRHRGNPWLNAALAGFAVGLGVVEGADNGAIFSLFIAAYVLFQSFIDETSLARRLTSSFRLGLVAVCAGLIASQVLISLIGIATRTARGSNTAPQASPEERAADEQARWVFATQWSLPPKEMLRLIIPGIYGYRTDTPDGGEYWGRVGEYWAAPDSPERRASRSSGAGEYAGVLVVLVGLWALAHACRRAPIPVPGGKVVFDDRERKFILVWAGLFIVAMVFSWGYHAPFYKLVYSLPYFSTIRNPMKFMHAGQMCLMILFGYGLLGLSRRYLEPALAPAGSLGERLKNWRAKALPVERWWFRGSIAAALVALLSFLMYTNSRASLTRHLQQNLGFPDPARAEAIARFSAGEVGVFAVVLAASVAVLVLMQLGVFAGARRSWAVLALGLLLTLDLARSNTPWIKYDNYLQQYALNPVLDVLVKEPWQHRVATFPPGLIQQREVAQQINLANQVWRGQWLQWHAQFYNIQSIDMAQDPRPPSEKTNYLAHVQRPNVSRLWELTNTRYLIGLGGGFTDQLLNQQLDPVRRSFRVVAPFAFTQTSAGFIGAQTNDAGPWALIEFGAALPRARLYTNWQVSTNDEATLNTLSDPAFDVHRTVLVNDPIAPPAAAGAATDTNAMTGVGFASYSPKHIVLRATATAPSVLLVNDQFDRDWKVTVNGKPAPLLRCNYLMRGVRLEPGAQEVVFDFRPSLKGMWITLASIAAAVAGCGLLWFSKPREPEKA